MRADLFTSDFKTTSYWWERTPRPAIAQRDLPSKADVLVVGSGYTGLHAALRTARGGRSTVVLDAEDAGWGCSTRNGGQISTSIKPSFAELTRRHGPDLARRILRDGHDSLAYTAQFVREEGIDCDFGIVGRFHAAHNPAKFDELARGAVNQPQGFEVPQRIVPRAEQRTELGTDAYFGGVVLEAHSSVDPARYHAGLLARVQAAGAEIHSRTPAIELKPLAGGGFDVVTPRGTCRARDVIVATNGYTAKVTPWLRRRVIPIGSYIIATEELDPGLMARLMPKDRIVSDTRKVVYYYRASPDRRRILFGGRVSHGETDPANSGPLLHAEMVRLFPELAGTKISHSWLGFVAYTFDELAHIGTQDGVHYAMGYCGSGAGMAGYLGMKLGLRVLGDADAATGLAETEFQTRPFYTGNPWFLAASVMYYRWRDRH